MFFSVFIFILFSFNLNSDILEAKGGQTTLSYGFYKDSCPQVENIVRAHLIDPTSAPPLLRLFFHDCQVQGCDASILLDSNNGGTPEIFSILAAREAVALSLGPYISVPLGRRDSSVAPSSEVADALLPPGTIGVDGMLQLFAGKGMTVEESVAIMGAHTLGVTHCVNILDRLAGDTNMSPAFEALLRLSCPFGSFTPNTSFVLNDPTTLLFDNHYYWNTLRGHGVLKIDADLATNPITSPFVQQFAANQGEFYRAFSSAFVKLSSYGVLTGEQGMIRRSCNKIR
ncbi:Peroxidase [Heracleum sosnowskyi]|uniref:Peroxidase n=1 Tax=Heracleum sosnowskyi TaxID=360622 RepID=A0AAD8II18_9APIA|nr:Peroxidase [Heracleum sosnowskyi]